MELKEFSGAAEAPRVVIWNMGGEITVHNEKLIGKWPAAYTMCKNVGKEH